MSATHFAELNPLLQTEMDRRGFLKAVGVGLLAVLGITTAIQALSGFRPPSKQSRPTPGSRLATYGYTAFREGKW